MWSAILKLAPSPPAANVFILPGAYSSCSSHFSILCCAASARVTVELWSQTLIGHEGLQVKPALVCAPGLTVLCADFLYGSVSCVTLFTHNLKVISICCIALKSHSTQRWDCYQAWYSCSGSINEQQTFFCKSDQSSSHLHFAAPAAWCRLIMTYLMVIW